MSELEKHVKTVSQIMEEYNQLPDYILQMKALEKQYVPVELYQNAIGELENHFDAAIHDYNVVQKNLSQKIIDLEAEDKQLKEELALYKKSDRYLASKVDPSIFANRLITLKWREINSYSDDVLIFQLLNGEKLEYQTTIPIKLTLADFDLAVVKAASELARFLKQETKQVLVELTMASLANQANKEPSK